MEYRRRGWKIEERNWKHPNAEVDLLVRSPLGKLAVVEVKSDNFSSLRSTRVSQGQKKRLQAVAVHLSTIEKSDVAVHLAFVDAKQRVEILEDPFW